MIKPDWNSAALAGLLRRNVNRALVEAELRMGRARLLGRPYILFVDPCNACNLRCPLCPTGVRMKGRKKGTMTREVFLSVLDQLGPYAVEMLLYNWGEPLLHPEIFSFVSLAEARGIRTLLSSNLNLLDAGKAEEMIRCGLRRLIISLDGVTADTYSAYRIGGDLERVKQNVKLLSSLKKRMGADRPRLTLQFLVFKHNEQDVPRVRDLAAELGVDDVQVQGGYLGGKGQTPYTGHPDTPRLVRKWLSEDPRYRGEFDYFREDGYLRDPPCFFLWRTVTVNWDGSVSPCCCVYEASTDFGNLMEEPFSKIWNNAKYRSARALFSRRADRGTAGTICSACKTFRPVRAPGAPSRPVGTRKGASPPGRVP